MKYINNRDVIFQYGIDYKITNDNEFLLKGIFPYVKNILMDCALNMHKPKTLIKLKKNLKKFSEVSFFYKLICDQYLVTDMKLFINFANKYYKKFPNEYFAKLNMAKAFIFERNVEGFKSIYGEDINIYKTFPNKKIYHILEITEFFALSVVYYLSILSLDDAIRSEKELAKIDENSHFHLEAKGNISRYRRDILGYKKVDIEVTNDIRNTHPYFGITPEIAEIIYELHDNLKELTEPNINFLVEAQIEADKHPDIPQFKELICNYHRKFKNVQLAVDSIYLLYEEHPNHLAAKLNMVETLLSSENLKTNEESVLNKVFEIYNKTLDFNTLTDRKIFHYAEFTSFNYMAIDVWLKKGLYHAAEHCQKMNERVIKLVLKETSEKENILTDVIEAGKTLLKNYNDNLKFNNLN